MPWSARAKDVAIITENSSDERIDLARAVGSASGHQYPAEGAQGLPLVHGWVAKAPTRGSRWQIPFPTLRVAMLASSIAAYAFCAQAIDADAATGAPPFSTSSFG
jgi:hypothetical protein